MILKSHTDFSWFVVGSLVKVKDNLIVYLFVTVQKAMKYLKKLDSAIYKNTYDHFSPISFQKNHPTSSLNA